MSFEATQKIWLGYTYYIRTWKQKTAEKPGVKGNCGIGKSAQVFSFPLTYPNNNADNFWQVE